MGGAAAGPTSSTTKRLAQLVALSWSAKRKEGDSFTLPAQFAFGHDGAHSGYVVPLNAAIRFARQFQMNPIKLALLFLLCALTTHAQLAVTVSPVRITGQKAVVTLAMTNNLATPVESARAVCFLLDDHGEMVGQSAKWVIGGTKNRAPLLPKAGTTFNFVVTSPRVLGATNLTAQISFSRVALTGQPSPDPKAVVTVQNASP